MVEFTIEPFVDGHPGEHVRAAWRAVEAHGLELQEGPFGSSVVARVDQLDAMVGDLLRAAMFAGAERISVQVERLAP